MMKHQFVVTERPSNFRVPGYFVLETDRWNDFGYRTSFHLYYNDDEKQVEIGHVKIAYADMSAHFSFSGGTLTSTPIPESFEQLDNGFFSLGQDREYYENMMNLPNGVGVDALSGLRDVAANRVEFQRHSNLEVFKKSLLRDLTEFTVETQFRRIVAGEPLLTPYKFAFTRDEEVSGTERHPVHINFKVEPHSLPSTNMHVLIGPNGAGKSQLLRDFVAAAANPQGTRNGRFHDRSDEASGSGYDLPFSSLVHIGFSAFESGLPQNLDGKAAKLVKLVGLAGIKSEPLEAQFLMSLRRCKEGPRAIRWMRAMQTLVNADSVLRDFDLLDLLRGPKSLAESRFRSMSSGHKIVVLTMSKLVELAEERTLVLIDEPETHLHPPLLSALIRSISDLMIGRNSVAVVATHSPVVLQEVPRRCVKIIHRFGDKFQVSELQTESFGESVSRLAAEVFQLNILHTGYHSVLADLIRKHRGDSRKALAELNWELGSEGHFVLSALAQDYQPNV